MTIHGARAGRLFSITGLVLLFAASATNAWGDFLSEYCCFFRRFRFLK